MKSFVEPRHVEIQTNFRQLVLLSKFDHRSPDDVPFPGALQADRLLANLVIGDTVACNDALRKVQAAFAQ